VFEAHRFCVSLNSRLESNKEEEGMDTLISFRAMTDYVAILRLPTPKLRFFKKLRCVYLHTMLSSRLHSCVSRAQCGSGSGGTWNVQWFRGGLVLKAHRLVYHSTLGVRVVKREGYHKSRRCSRDTYLESPSILVYEDTERGPGRRGKCEQRLPGGPAEGLPLRPTGRTTPAPSTWCG